jgi:hypothetical protein
MAMRAIAARRVAFYLGGQLLRDRQHFIYNVQMSKLKKPDMTAEKVCTTTPLHHYTTAQQNFY